MANRLELSQCGFKGPLKGGNCLNSKLIEDNFRVDLPSMDCNLYVFGLCS